ncbi:pyridoxal phosphate-dependent aminotransferase [Faecalibacter rhinopitheci]|uniref:Pyridoxal phosphate-dependent aminotransferase n=1 Tax=Faecalibacter rhinopitheci TaxID=2779678 RepID=A0A8J7FUV5_9FLAO|nr:pyridoxal phosphate-dependent aminotransferase [Faecalibacter rhinopitheci]MBF0598242.1 pyridoxal phosphate-dependent aminotransferase [Faecalibacter rhinopitheci]MBQ0148555.1 pyridoxal phosphate-dependent aminotransferase [Candidatus Onthonaster equi]
MLVLSDKSQKMPASPIRKLVPYADAAKQRGTKVYHLNIGQPDIESPNAVLEGLKNFPSKVVSYTHSEGTLEYRQALANYYNNRGIDVTEKDFIATLGGSEALLFIFGIIANPGDEIIIPEPFYANYNGFTCENDVNIVPVPSTIENNFGLPPVEEFAKKITDKTRAILICNPGNPTGYVYSKEELEQLKEIVLKHDIYLIADEVYAEYLYTEEPFTSVLSFPELKNHAIVIDSESKRFSLCGARSGAIVTRNQAFLDAAMRFAQARLSPVELSQYMATLAHQNVGTYFEDCRAEYLKRRDVLVNGLKQIPGVIVPNPKGAFYCMIQLPVDNAEKFAIWLLESFASNGETVMLAPGAGFYSTPNSGLQEVRLAYVLKEEDLVRSVEILKEALVQYPGTIR